MSDHDIIFWTLIITAIGVAAGLFALFFAWRTILEAQKQARDNAKTAKAQFWILLRGVFARYDDIHANFRPMGDWVDDRKKPYNPKKGPQNALDMARIEVYMGLFEYCYGLLEQGLIDEQTFSDSYKYRLENLVRHRWVSDIKLGPGLRDHWEDFISLCDRLDVEIPTLTDEERLDLKNKVSQLLRALGLEAL